MRTAGIHRSPVYASHAPTPNVLPTCLSGRAMVDATKGGDMRKWTMLKDDAGMATVEYALVTVAAAAFAGVLLVLLKSAAVKNLLMGIIERALG